MKKLFSLAVSFGFVFQVLGTTSAFAVPQDINGAGANCGAACVAEGVTFTTNHTLTIDDDTSVGNTAGASFNPGADDFGTVTANVDTNITGTVGTAAGDSVASVTLANAGTDVTFSGNVFSAGAIAIGAANQSVILADNVNITTDATSVGNTSGSVTGTLTVQGTSTISGAVGTGGAGGLSVINAGATGETATFTGGTIATTMNVTGTGNIALNGGHSGILDYDAAGTVTLATAQAITGNITNSTGTDGSGTLVFANVANVNGSIGASGAGLGLITVGGAGAKAVTGSIFATTVNYTSTGTLSLSDNANLTATVTTGTPGQGGLTFNGTSSASSTIGTNANYLGNIALNGVGETVTFSGNVFATDFTQNDAGTVNIGANTIDLNGSADGDFAMSANGTLALTINSSTVFGNILANGATGTAVFSGTNSLTVTVNGGIANGQTFQIATATDDGVVAVPGTITDNSALISFAATEPTTGDLVLTATVNSANVATTSSANNAFTAVNAAVAAGASAEFTNALAPLYGSSDVAVVTAALDSLDPIVDGAVTQGSFNAMNQSMAAFTSHLDNARAGVSTGETGFSTGDAFNDATIWVKGLGNFSNQDDRGGVDGYDAWTGGAAGGIDWAVDNDWRFGLGGGLAYTDIESDSDPNDANISSPHVTVYGSYNPEPYYVDLAFSYAWNSYETQRGIPFAGQTAEGDFDGGQYTLLASGGYVIKQDVWEITPLASFQYSNLDLDGYTETGSALALRVEGQEYDFAQLGLGAKLARPFTNDHGTWIPEVHAKWLYDFAGDRMQTTATFTGGGPAFTTNGADPAQHSLNLGAGVTLVTKGNTSFILNYDAELKEDFVGHSGSLTMKIRY